MKKNLLGNTTIRVSELCFGTLTLGPLQKNVSVADAQPILETAHALGVNFYDTADLYDTYAYLKPLIRRHNDIVVCTRSYDYSAAGLNKSLERALRELGRDYVDVYLLHEQESRHTFEGHWEAVEALLKAKAAGKVRAVGISTHRVQAVRDSLDYSALEVLFPLINCAGIGIEDGTAEQMRAAISAAKEAGKGIFAMKPLGGGTLLRRRQDCFAYTRALLGDGLIDACAFGMQSVAEVRYNAAQIAGRPVSASLEEAVNAYPRHLHIDDWCQGCGACARKCHQGALEIRNGRAAVDSARCLTCGYCASACPVFAIKVV